ncbi:MAG TPA: hypothetical protein VGD91_20030, partial [Trebonia sp.]
MTGLHDVVVPLGGPVAGLRDEVFAAASWRALAPLLASIKFARLSPDGGVSFPAGKHFQRVLRGDGLDLPADPATITTGNILGEGALLVGDFDVAKAAAKGAVDPVAQVALEAARFVALVERCGGRAIHDTSPSGGRHVYVRFARSRPWPVLQQIALALARRFGSFDAGPMRTPQGQIRPPGAPHKRTVTVMAKGKRGGHRLTGALTGYLT